MLTNTVIQPARVSKNTPAPRPPIVVTHEHGLRFAARVRKHRVFVDQPSGGGGTDTAPTPLELIGTALGTCVALYVTTFLARRSLPYETLKVEVDQARSEEHHGVGAYTVRVMLPVRVGDHMLQLIDRVARTCPVHHTLQQGVKIVVEVQEP